MNVSMGLFSADLSDFFLHCAVASYYCDYHAYHSWADGWAIGSFWEVTPGNNYADAIDQYFNGICLDDRSCFGF
jgi:hypothetical protein